MEEIVKHINDTNASYRSPNAGDAKNTDLFLDNEHYELFKESGDKITVRFSKVNLSKAILFIASILPRKYDNSSDHKTVNYSASFVYNQLALLDAFFKEDGNPVDFKTQVWNCRKNVVKKNGDVDSRFYFNGLLETFSYVSSSGETITAKFSIRNYLAGGYSDLHIRKADDGIFDVFITNAVTPSNNRGISQSLPVINNMQELPLQQITYGAPGTGKSFGIDEDVKKYHLTAIRTTFHPDSDYATFVGAYKPQMTPACGVRTQTILDYSTLVDKFKEYLDAKPVNITKACTLFGYDYHDSIVNMENYGKTIPELVSDAYKSGTTYDSQVRAGMSVYEQTPRNNTSEKKIIYKFSKQAFLKAYIDAWKDLENPYVLVIEEINRGNCAQIFGDLFQLLDRNDDGFSSYPIDPDTDIIQVLNEEFEGLEISSADAIDGLYNENVMDKVLSGNKLLLPNNLYIWATMNTSDQSLFPIDSAFKRRWEWKYVPISDAGKRWVICINGVRYDWWSFVDAINRKIWDATHSEDKKLGYFFCKANKEDGVITADKFVGKVLFYIYNDVFKDYGFDDAIFKDEQNKDDSYLLFKDFFMPDGKPREDKIQVFLKNLGVKTEEEVKAEMASIKLPAEDTTNDEGDTVNEPDAPGLNPPQAEIQTENTENPEENIASQGNDTTKYTFDGYQNLGKGQLAIKVVEKYLAEHPELTFDQIKETFPDDMMGQKLKALGFIVKESDMKNAPYSYQKKVYGCFNKDRKKVSSDGVAFFVSNNWNITNIQAIIDFALANGWTVSKEV